VATLLALREHGHRVINLACGLGRPEQEGRRRAELEAACSLAGFELRIADPAARDDEEGLAALVLELAAAEGARLVVSPSPHDRHPAHELVGRAARAAAAEARLRWWMWGLWGDLPLPTLYHGFGEERLGRALQVLAAHAGELARNDYAALVRGRAQANRVLGSERVFGWGAAMRPEPYAELLTEAAPDGAGGWTAGAARVLDPAEPLASEEPGPRTRPLGWWLDGESFTDRARAAGLEPPGDAPTPADPGARR
jgi:LmbE family N-acetylglucosaminyl deacetylase